MAFAIKGAIVLEVIRLFQIIHFLVSSSPARETPGEEDLLHPKLMKVTLDNQGFGGR